MQRRGLEALWSETCCMNYADVLPRNPDISPGSPSPPVTTTQKSLILADDINIGDRSMLGIESATFYYVQLVVCPCGDFQKNVQGKVQRVMSYTRCCTRVVEQ